VKQETLKPRIAFLVVPFVINDYWANALLVPFLIYAIAAIGLNILTGYCGQVSLGTGAFMAVGAYACYKLMTAFPEINILIHVLLAGGITALVGAAFGLPSLRIKGFYLAVATLAAQFFLVWLFNKVPWFYNNSASGQISAPERFVFGVPVTGPNGSMGRKWMAIRDMDIAAEIIGVNPLRAKLSAFAISSFFVGISGALFFAVYLGAVEVGEVFGITKSFLVLFMVIIGGLGSIFGSFAGAAFIVGLPVVLKLIGVDLLGWAPDLVAHIQLIVIGLLIMFFLIKEPHGLAQLWRVAKEKLRLWPFPY